MAQTKEEQQEKARQRRENAEWSERMGELIRGRPLRPGEGKAVRSEWDTGVFDPSDRHRHVWCRYNYRLRRDEWSYDPVPPEYARDYDSSAWPKLPDGRSAVMYPEEAAKLGIGTGPLVEATPARPRRFVLPPIDKFRL